MSRLFDEIAFRISIYDWAIRYINRGWAVLPLHSIDQRGRCTCGKKKCKRPGEHPRTPNGARDASRDLAQIEKWFGPEAPLSNIGIATGAVSDITVLTFNNAGESYE